MAQRRSSGDTALNVIITVVIVAVLGLGAWAVAPKISEKAKERAQQQTEQQEQQATTIGQMAEQEGISFDEYVQKYGIADAELTAEDPFENAAYLMTVENFAKATQTTAEELMSTYEFPESVTAQTKWGDAIPEMPARVAMGGEEQFNKAKEAYGLGDEFTADSRWGDVQNAIIQKMIEQQQAAQASAEPEASAEPTAEAKASAEPKSSTAPTAEAKVSAEPTEKPKASAEPTAKPKNDTAETAKPKKDE